LKKAERSNQRKKNEGIKASANICLLQRIMKELYCTRGWEGTIVKVAREGKRWSKAAKESRTDFEGLREQIIFVW